MYSWGNNDYGEAGVGTTGDQMSPRLVVSGEMPAGVSIQIASRGWLSSAVLGTDGRVYTFGLSTVSGAEPASRAVPGLGLNFEVAEITFDGTPGTDLTSAADSTTVVTPAHEAGPVDVVVNQRLCAGTTGAQFPHAQTFLGGFTYVAPIQPPVITTPTLPDGVVSDGYTSPVEATGDGPITFAVTDGDLPDGLTLDPVTGIVSGTPTAEGTFTFTVTATNAGGSDTREYTVTVRERPVITTPTLPDGTVGGAYGQTVEATGTGPITFAVSGGSLPPGLVLDPATGLISGTATTAGSYTFTITASNAVGEDTREYTIVIPVTPVVTPPPTVPPAGGLSTTGGDVPWTPFAIGGLLALLGAAMIVRRRIAAS